MGIGNLVAAAAKVQEKGSKNVKGDSVLAHITPDEAALLKARGGMGKRDPDTGALHFSDSGGGYGDGGGEGHGGFGGGGFGGGFGDSDGNSGGFSDGYGGFTDGGYSAGMGWGQSGNGGFNAAQDSQAASAALGLSPSDVSGFTGGVQIGNTNHEVGVMDQLATVAKNPYAQLALSLAVPGLAPAIGIAKGVMGLMDSKSPQDAARNAAGMALGFAPGIGGVLGRGAFGAATSNNPSSSIGSSVGGFAGSALGGMVGGPAGAAIGGMAGRTAGASIGNSVGKGGFGGTSGSSSSGNDGGGSGDYFMQGYNNVGSYKNNLNKLG